MLWCLPLDPVCQWIDRFGVSRGPESVTGAVVALCDPSNRSQRFAGRRFGRLRLIFHPIPNPAVNNLPLVANRAEVEKVMLATAGDPVGRAATQRCDLLIGLKFLEGLNPSQVIGYSPWRLRRRTMMRREKFAIADIYVPGKAPCNAATKDRPRDRREYS
jgi:hypothetical protein